MVFQTATLTAGADFAALDSGLTTDVGPNQGVFMYVVDTGSRTIVLHAAFAVSTNCTATGWAAPST